MISFTSYITATGEILAIHTAPSYDAISLETGQNYVDGHYDGVTYYIPSGTPTARPTSSCSADTTTVDADGVDVVTISNADSGAIIEIDDIIVGTADGTDIELTFDTVGEYLVRITSFPDLPWEVTINAS